MFTKVQELIYELKVSNVMVRDVITVSPDAMMSDLRTMLKQKRISGCPVVRDRKLLGIISIEDFIKWLMEGGENCPISKRMTKEVETLYDDESLVHAVEKMESFGFGRFPIITRKEKEIIGVLTKGTIIQGVLKKLEVDYVTDEIQRYRASHIFEDIIANNKSIHLVYNIQGGNFENAGESSTNLKKTLKRLGINPEIIRKVAIAAYEAEMNLVFYTSGGKMHFKVSPEKIDAEISDDGPGIEDIEKAMVPGFSTAPDWVRELGFGAGLGLSNIKKCSDHMDIQSVVGKGTNLKFEMAVSE
jgi:CBS domain-containing protein/anti-sigma regulatory factor (Ser/Thr protein kinase)